jgi:peptidoglycan/xylan/chitin deacetylase (PgdA/CDA1 family)
MSQLVFSLSVDDGHPLDLRIAERLVKHGLRASFYLPIRNAEGPPVMTAAQARELSQHFEIGSHTLDHHYLTRVGDGEAWRQIIEGKTELEQRLGQAVTGFCYPGGQFHGRHVRMVKRAGFAYARTIKNLYSDAGEQRWQQQVADARPYLSANFCKKSCCCCRYGTINGGGISKGHSPSYFSSGWVIDISRAFWLFGI